MTFSLAKVLQALASTHLYASEKNAYSIPGCEHCISYFLNTLKYHRTGNWLLTFFRRSFLCSLRESSPSSVLPWCMVLLAKKKRNTSPLQKNPKHCFYVIDSITYYSVGRKHSIAQLPSSVFTKASKDDSLNPNKYTS